ncbi:hypothetical protein [Pseudomonas abietaniphila]|uniref:hypothetical protein n=1 Tax=Pseudomonas abietaniphila TaxID=89065 RepID=UPI000A87F515|nr:hypothetical protein [Pseudomonas abietaniphila]
MRAFIWKLRALYWFWKLADYPSWEAASDLHDTYVAEDGDPEFWDPEGAVREELSYWSE